MLKPVSGAERLTRPSPVQRVDARLPMPPPLGEATVRTTPTAFEQALRAALVSLKEGLARVDAEVDPLAKHLGFRSLAKEAEGAAQAPEQLTRPDEQQWGRELLQSVHAGVERSGAQLDDGARLDLELLLKHEVRAQERAQAEARCAAALAAEERERVAARHAAERLAQTERQAARVQAPRPSWQQAVGGALGIVGLLALLLLVLSPESLQAWARGLPAVRWTTLFTALGALGVGAWLSVDPQLRRAWVNRRLLALVEQRRTTAEREAAASAALAHAKRLFDAVDAECRQEEAQLRALVDRRPGLERYASLAPAQPERSRGPG